MDDCAHCTPCALQRIEATLKRMEITMANETEQLNAIKAKLADVSADVQAKLEQVRAEVSPEGQAAFDEVMSALQQLDAEVGDADGSDAAGVQANPGQVADGQPASEQTDAGDARTPDNATDENGTPLDEFGNPRV